MAHARRKFHDLYANHRSDIAAEALRLFGELYEIERQARDQKLDAEGRLQLRQQRSKPLAETLRQWLVCQKNQVPDGSATAKAIEYSLGRWAALTRYLSGPLGDALRLTELLAIRFEIAVVLRCGCTSLSSLAPATH
jgi:hypothetical protein